MAITLRDARCTPSLCPSCATGCATLVYHRGNSILGIEGDPSSPVNGGTLCAKGAALCQLHAHPARWTTCAYRAPGATEWQEVSLEWSLERIAQRVKETRDASFQEQDEQRRHLGRTLAIGALGGAMLDGEESYLLAKLARSLGLVFVESVARFDAAVSAHGLRASFCFGAASTTLMDLQHADLILIQGSNLAETHPVAYRFIAKAQAGGATVVHVDPRFTRTSALADLHVPIRPGTDIAFLGGLITYVLEHERYAVEYVLHHTDAPFVVHEDFRDSEDLEGIFSGFDPERGVYDTSTWCYELETAPDGLARPKRDLSLAHPRCVLNVLKRHYARYTPEMVERVCGTPQERFLDLAQRLCANGGREKTAAICFGSGLTQHTTGVQNVRAGAILQMLLGNAAGSGRGLVALHGHASSQGSLAGGLLYDLLPGPLPAPSLERGEAARSAWRGNGHAASLMKTWYGPAASAENDWAFDYLPKSSGNHSQQPMFVAMKDGAVRGLMLLGADPVTDGPSAEFTRTALGKLDWLVVRDHVESESAAFWKREGVDPKQIATEVFFLPAAAVAEKAGTLTNSTRRVQLHEQAVDPPDDCRSDLTFVYGLGTRLKRLYTGSTLHRDRPILDMTWSYEHPDRDQCARGEANVEAVMRELNGCRLAAGEQPIAPANAEGAGALFAARGTMVDGPFPTHYEPMESPLVNAVYPKVQVNPVLEQWCRRDNPYHEPADPNYPYVVTTCRLPWLTELKPEPFCEISPELAAERGLRNGDWSTIETARGQLEVRTLVTGRLQPLRLGHGRVVHVIGLPWPSELSPLVGDPNVSTHEGKAFTCTIRPGRRSISHVYAADDDVPLRQRNPLGTPGHAGKVCAAAPHERSALK